MTRIYSFHQREAWAAYDCPPYRFCGVQRDRGPFLVPSLRWPVRQFLEFPLILVGILFTNILDVVLLKQYTT